MQLRSMAAPLAKGLLAGLITAMVAPAAIAGDSPWLIRGRLLNMSNDNGNSPSMAGGPLEASNKTFVEVDATYFFNKNLAVEVIAALPQKHDVELGGAKIGTVKQLPPTVLAQYHFDLGAFKPYVGAGVNLTKFWDVKLPAGITMDRTSVGVALQVGADYKLDKDWYINVDVKKIYIASQIQAGGADLTKLKIDPTIVGIGLGYRF